MATQKHSDCLHRFVMFALLCTFALIGMGGLVTSREAGLAVPDWPTSFGYNMFLLPFDQWIGKFGTFEEHSHRLMASLVGLLTAVITGWIWSREATCQTRNLALASIFITLGLLGVRTQWMFIAMACAATVVIVFSIIRLYRDRNALRWWATLAYCIVIVQGVLGGLRVTQLKEQIGVFHGTLAQLFLLVLGAIALFTSQWWRESHAAKDIKDLAPRVVRSHFFYATLLIFLQLIIGTTMRHQHAGLPVWDFPRAHGQWWPSTNENSLALYNANRDLLQKELHAGQKTTDTKGNPALFLTTGKPIQANHITLHMTHRIMALLIFGLVLGAVIVTRKKLGTRHALSKLSLLWFGLILIQAILGALTVLKYKPADIATLHVLFGAGSLLIGTMGTLVSRSRELPALAAKTTVETNNTLKLETVSL